MNLQSENVPHFLCLLSVKQFQFFWKFKTDRTAFFKNPVQKKICFLKIFRQKQLWINCEQRQKNRRCYSTSYACYQKKTNFKGAWESPNLRSRNNRKKLPYVATSVQVVCPISFCCPYRWQNRYWVILPVMFIRRKTWCVFSRKQKNSHGENFEFSEKRKSQREEFLLDFFLKIL